MKAQGQGLGPRRRACAPHGDAIEPGRDLTAPGLEVPGGSPHAIDPVQTALDARRREQVAAPLDHRHVRIAHHDVGDVVALEVRGEAGVVARVLGREEEQVRVLEDHPAIVKAAEHRPVAGPAQVLAERRVLHQHPPGVRLRLQPLAHRREVLRHRRHPPVEHHARRRPRRRRHRAQLRDEGRHLLIHPRHQQQQQQRHRPARGPGQPAQPRRRRHQPRPRQHRRPQHHRHREAIRLGRLHPRHQRPAVGEPDQPHQREPARAAARVAGPSPHPPGRGRGQQHQAAQQRPLDHDAGDPRVDELLEEVIDQELRGRLPERGRGHDQPAVRQRRQQPVEVDQQAQRRGCPYDHVRSHR